MRSNHADITIVLDRSGSMGVVATDTIAGFNKFLSEQKQTPGTATITLNQFNHRYERVIDAQDIALAFPLTNETFVPRGNTALLDAMGKSINDTGDRLAKMEPSQRPGKVIVVIITDGQENDSKEFTRDQINKMVDHQRDNYHWEFVFLGANQDAILEAMKYGINAGNAITYAHNSAGTSKAFSALSQNMSAVRCCTADSMEWKASDRAEQEKAGAI